MKKDELKRLIDTAAGRIPADVVIKNCKIVNVFSGNITEGSIAICGDQIAGIGEYEGKEVSREDDMRRLDLSTAIFILNLPMSVRRRSAVCSFRTAVRLSLQIHMRLSMFVESGD